MLTKDNSGVWKKTVLEYELQQTSVLNEEVKFWAKCLNASLYNWTSSLNDIYPHLGNQYVISQNDTNKWELPLKNSGKISQKGYFEPEKALKYKNVIEKEVDLLTFNQNINILNPVSNIRIDNQFPRIGQLIVLKDQKDTTQNGLYEVNDLFFLTKVELKNEPYIFNVRYGRYNREKRIMTALDANGVPIKPYKFIEGDSWLIRSKAEYKTERTFAFYHTLPHYSIVVGDNGLIMNYEEESIKMVDTRNSLRFLAEDDNGILYAVGDRGAIVQSIDFGDTWRSVSLETERNFKWVGTIGDYIVVAGDLASLFFSKDKGNTWQKVSIPRRYTKTINFVYLTVKEGKICAWCVGKEGLFLEVILETSHVTHYKLESDLKNEAILSHLQKLYPFKNGFLILGNDSYGWFSLDEKKYYDLYPSSFMDQNTIMGEEESGRNWVGCEIWADGETMSIIYLFSEKGEIFKSTIHWEKINYYSQYSVSWFSFELLHQLNIGEDRITSVENGEDEWVLSSRRRSIFKLNYETLELTELNNFDHLFKNRLLILDYFLARKLENIVEGEKIVPRKIFSPTININSINDFYIKPIEQRPTFIEQYKKYDPSNLHWRKKSDIQERQILELKSKALNEFIKPQNQEWIIQTEYEDYDYIDITPFLSSIDTSLIKDNSNITLVIEWLDGFLRPQQLIREVDVVENNSGLLKIYRVIEDAPQLNEYECKVKIFLNPFRIIGNEFVVDFNAFEDITGTTDFVFSIETFDNIRIKVYENENKKNILNENFIFSKKEVFDDKDRIIFHEKVDQNFINDINQYLHFYDGRVDFINLNVFGDDDIHNKIKEHNIGKHYSIHINNSNELKEITGNFNYINAYFSLSCKIQINDDEYILDYSSSKTVWNPDYNLIDFLKNIDSTLDEELEIEDLKINPENKVVFPWAKKHDSQLIIKTNYDRELEKAIDFISKNIQYFNIKVGTQQTSILIVDVKHIEGQTWLLVTDKPLDISINEEPMELSSRIKLKEINRDLEWTDDIHLRLRRTSSYTTKVRLSNVANSLLKNKRIRELLTAALYVDENGDVVMNFFDISDDPNWCLRPVDIFPIAKDNLPKKAVWINDKNFSQKNPEWKKVLTTLGKKPSASLINVDKERIRYRLVDSLTLPLVQEKYNWILNAHIDNALIGLNENEKSEKNIVWYLGEWFCGFFEGGQWVSGDWYDGIWNGGLWDSLFVEDLFNRARILEDMYDGKRSNWWGGLWKMGVWNGGVWWGGKWKNGDFLKGLWQAGYWYDGNHFDGLWRGGTWYKGNWFNGRFNGRNYRSVWRFGTWFGGDFENGLWVNGIFNSSSLSPSRFGTDVTRYHRAIWLDGIWNDGQFMARHRDKKRKNWKQIWMWSTWENGEWRNGHFKCGHFKKGKWYKGVFFEGVFGIKDVSTETDTIWYHGHFVKGQFLGGLWENGIMEMGLRMGGKFLNGEFGVAFKRTRKKYIKKGGKYAKYINRNIRINKDERRLLYDKFL